MTITQATTRSSRRSASSRGGAARDARGRFVAEGEDLVAAAGAAGWTRGHDAVRRRQRPRWRAEVEPALLAGVSSLGSGTRPLGVYEQRWAGARRAAVRRAVGRRRPRQRRDDPALGARLRRGLGRRSAPAAPTRSAPRPCARRWARSSPCRSRARRRRGAAGRAHGARRARGGAARGPGSGAGTTIVVGAERDGLRPSVVAACDRVAHIPIAGESLNAAMAATVALYELHHEAAALRMAPA